MERSIVLKSRGAELEAFFGDVYQERAVVITHPHPLYGGSMDNPVVTTIGEAYAESGWSTLRFNFRGVGNSSGRYGDGIDEQLDVQAAVDHLVGFGIRQIDLAGYSFGAWVIANWARANPAHKFRLTLVAPPVAFVAFDCEAGVPGLHHVITGDGDDIAPLTTIKKSVPNWGAGATLSIVQGADHFYQGQLTALRKIIADSTSG